MASDSRGYASMIPRLCVVSLLIVLFAIAFAMIVSTPSRILDRAPTNSPCVLQDGQGCGPT